jgi:hypothetical protein
MASSASLYGDRDPTKTKTKHKPINSSSSLAFSSNLSSLIASSKSKGPTTDQEVSKSKRSTDLLSTSSAPKASLFIAHRSSSSNTSKKRRRSPSDHDSSSQNHKTSADLGSTDSSELARSKRKMLEKTRLYNAMKRGEYIGREADYDAKGGLMVDFDKKWADSQSLNDDLPSPSHSQHDDLSATDSDTDTDSPARPSKRNGPTEEKTETYIDTFGRAIPCTPTQKRRHERRARIAALAAASLEDSRARPTTPTSQLIYGDTIQTSAFNPDHITQTKMAELAAKRDREATPPEDAHYDGKAEIRTKGTGWYGFSRDEEGRKGEMEGLEKERLETERVREEKGREREEERDKRRREVEERRRKVEARRRGREVDEFLEGLELPAVEGGGGDGDEDRAEGETRGG